MIWTKAEGQVRLTDASFTPQTDLDLWRYRVWSPASESATFNTAWSMAEGFYIGPAPNNPVSYKFNARPEFSWEAMPGVKATQIWIIWIQRGNTIEDNQRGITGNTFTSASDLPAGEYGKTAGGFGRPDPAAMLARGLPRKVEFSTSLRLQMRTAPEMSGTQPSGRYWT
jgi:hypothetical protein